MKDMDIFAHGLWTGALAYVGKHKFHYLRIGWSAFWGVFPDLFAFTIPFAWIFFQSIFSRSPVTPRVDTLEPGSSLIPTIFQATSILYSMSHSLIIFAIVFALVTIFFRRPRLEMLGWLLHILIDIPSHSYQFYPTPFLWPLSNIRFNGYAWSHPIFMVVNYAALVIVSIAIFIHRRRNKRLRLTTTIHNGDVFTYANKTRER